jgi:hypothetical protein
LSWRSWYWVSPDFRYFGSFSLLYAGALVACAGIFSSSSAAGIGAGVRGIYIYDAPSSSCIPAMSAGVTSDPSQPERPCDWARLSSSGAEVAIILDEAIVVAEIGRESWSPVLLVLAEAEQRGKLVSLANKSHTG